jgi:hypothetical protein
MPTERLRDASGTACSIDRDAMETLTIQAASPQSARAMLAALSGFEAELIEATDGRCEVVVTLARGDREVVAVLNALEEYVTERARGPARLELNGRNYVLHPESDGGG